MPLIADAACGVDLIARFRVSPGFEFEYSHISRISTTLSARAMSSPIPHRTTIIDHVRNEMDQLTIEGFLGCLGCGDATNSIGAIYKLKQSIVAQTYNADSFFNIVTPRTSYNRMILTGVNVNETDTRLAYVNVTTTWLGANLAGTITSPSFDAGGVYA